jgi:26S proteasome non-ATPase regulatory subunit 9
LLLSSILGFPRGDINIHDVRTKRNRLAIINTDYRILMKQIETEITRLHAESSAVSIPALPPPSPSSETENKPPSMLIPFAKLDEVQENSPAMLAGICNNDLLISFGGVDISTLNPMSVIPSEVGKHTNKPMDVVVLRGTVTHSLSLTPCTWSGRGLIGCHLTPL